MLRTVQFLSLSAVLALTACGPKVSTIELSPTVIDLGKKGEVKPITATAMDAEKKKVENVQIAFASSDPKVATVDAAGKVTAVDSGDAKITATFEQISASTPVKVSIPASLSFAPAEVILDGIGSKARVAAKVVDSKGREIRMPVAFASASPAIATVAGNEVTAVGAGETTLAATAGDLKGSVKVTVKVPVVASIEVPKTLDLATAGETATLKPEGKDASGKIIPSAAFTFTSADEKIATVDATGAVKAVKKGKTKITVASGEQSATVDVQVKK